MVSVLLALLVCSQTMLAMCHVRCSLTVRSCAEHGTAPRAEEGQRCHGMLTGSRDGRPEAAMAGSTVRAQLASVPGCMHPEIVAVSPERSGGELGLVTAGALPFTVDRVPSIGQAALRHRWQRPPPGLVAIQSRYRFLFQLRL